MKTKLAIEYKVNSIHYVGMSKTPLQVYHPEDIFEIVCKSFDITKEELSSKRSNRIICDAIKCFIYLSTKYLYPKPNLTEIGKMINKDHSTIVYHLKKFNELTEGKSMFKAIVNSIEEELLKSRIDSSLN